MADEADLDEEPDSHFELISSALDTLEEIGPDDDATNLITAARKTIALEVKKLVERKEERDSEKEDTADWTQISAVSKKDDDPPLELPEVEARSIFDDVDQ